MVLRLSLHLPEDFALLSLVRRQCRSFLEALHIAEQDISDIETVVGELACNAVRHGASPEYRVELECRVDRVVVRVVDEGPGFCLGEILPAGTPRTDHDGGERVGGWGIPLVRSLADQVEFAPNHPRGTAARAEMRLRHAVTTPR